MIGWVAVGCLTSTAQILVANDLNPVIHFMFSHISYKYIIYIQLTLALQILVFCNDKLVVAHLTTSLKINK